MGCRYQMVAGGREFFLADLKEDRVWRYFHHTKEGGFAKEDEGFLPGAMYYGCKKLQRRRGGAPTPTAGGNSGEAGGEKSVMISRALREDLAWAAFILGVAAFLGVVQHWTLVKVSLRGELPRHLEQFRAQRRASQFQGLKTVSLAQAHTLWQEGQTLFLDAQELPEYREMHIPGALSIPPELLEKEWDRSMADVIKGRHIVVYCSQASCDAALKVAERLQSLGYTEVLTFTEGFRAWNEAGYQVETIR
jgi:rhodanese-related sulfurtransferase